jgi:putative tricarboxylic transport membrane protein
VSDSPNPAALSEHVDGERTPGTARAHARVATRVRRLVAVGALLVGAAYLFASWDLDVGTGAEPGPGLMPCVVAVGLVLGAVLALVERVEPSAEVEEPPDRSGTRRQAVVLGALTAYVAALPVLGFLVSSVLALTACSWTITPQRSLRRATIIGVAIALVVDIAFRLLLNVNLPAGLWDIRAA